MAKNRKVFFRHETEKPHMHKVQKNQRLAKRETVVNKVISKLCYAVERTFGSMHKWFGAGVARYAGLANTHPNTSWRLSHTTCIAPLGLLCRLPQLRGYTDWGCYVKSHIYEFIRQFGIRI